MTTTSNGKKPCKKCGTRNWVFLCDGCHESFCVKHASEHRTELSVELDNLVQQYNHLKNLYDHHEKRQEHPLCSQIDVWEYDAIIKIQQAAETARDELRQLLDESNSRMKTILSQFHDQLHRERENDHYTEIDINQWKEQLVMIRKQLETPSDIELIPDMQLAPIYFIKVTAIKPETLLQIPVISQITVSCNERNDIDCSCDDNDLDIAKSNITNTDDKSNIEDTHEVSQILEEKEEEEITTTMESCPPMPLVEPRVLLDPTKKNHLVVLELSHTLQSQLSKNLLKLTDHPVKTFNQEDDYLNDLKCMEQTILFIDLTSLLFDERNRLLDNLSELENIYFLYIQGKSVHDDDECGYFFRRYPKIKAMFENEQRLLVQWTIDTVNEYKEAGDMYTELGDKDRGRQCFEEGIKLYNHLSEFLHEKRRIR